MATEKKFTVAGVSDFHGQTKIRFANDLGRIKTLVKKGHTNIDLLELPEPMTKPEIISYLKSIGYEAGRFEVADAMDQVMYRNPVTVRAKVSVENLEEA